MFGAPLGLLLLATAQGADLSAPLGASARPSPCLPRTSAPNDDGSPQSSTPSPWDEIRRGDLADYCKALARAHVQLLGHPEAALASARTLQRAWPGRPEPWVLEARAHTRMRVYAQAWPAWQAARERGHDFRSPYALREYAIAAAMNGHAELALDSYRRLVTLVSLWPEPRDRQRLYLEAAGAALRRGSESLEESSGYLTGVRPRATSTGLRAYVAGMDALIAHRRRQPVSEIERIDAAEIWYFVARVRDEHPPSHWPVVPPHEAYGAASLLVEKYSASEAGELWELYVRGLEKAPLDPASMALARERLSRLKAPGGS